MCAQISPANQLSKEKLIHFEFLLIHLEFLFFLKTCSVRKSRGKSGTGGDPANREDGRLQEDAQGMPEGWSHGSFT